MSYLADLYKREPPEEYIQSLLSATSSSSKSKQAQRQQQQQQQQAQDPSSPLGKQQQAQQDASFTPSPDPAAKKKGGGNSPEQPSDASAGNKPGHAAKYIEFDFNVEKSKYEAEPIAEMPDGEFLRRWNLARAARRGNMEAIDRLLRLFRTYPRWAGTLDGDGFSALMHAADSDDDAAGAAAIARLAGVEGVDPETASGTMHQWRAMHRAVIRGNHLCVRALLEKHNALPDCVDASKRVPLHYCALHNNRIDCARELIRAGCALSSQDALKRTPLHLAGESGSLAMIELLCQARAEREARDVNAMTPLLYAASLGRHDSVAVLAELGADVEARDYGWGTALLVACEKAAESHEKPELQSRYLETVRVLIERCNADVEAPTRDTGMRPVHLAARRACVRLIALLLQTNCWLDSRTVDKGRSAMHLLALAEFCGGTTKGAKLRETMQRYEQAARMLMETARVDVLALDKALKSPIMIAEALKHFELYNAMKAYAGIVDAKDDEEEEKAAEEENVKVISSSKKKKSKSEPDEAAQAAPAAGASPAPKGA